MFITLLGIFTSKVCELGEVAYLPLLYRFAEWLLRKCLKKRTSHVYHPSESSGKQAISYRTATADQSDELICSHRDS